MANVAARFLAHIAQFCFQHIDLPWLKRPLWNKFVEPYIAWRTMAFDGRTSFGSIMRLHLPDQIQSRIFFFGFWEPAISEYISSALKPGDIFIDVGANVGYYTLLASKLVGRTGRVFALEASPTIFGQLKANLERNDALNVTARNVAITTTRCKLPIYLHGAHNIGASTILHDVAETKGAVLEAMVDGVPLKDVVDTEAICAARIIKIDVEGAEQLVVEGIKDILPKLSNSTEVVMEIAGYQGRDVLLDLFIQAGFTPYVIPNSYLPDFYIAPPPVALRPYKEGSIGMIDIVLRKCPA
jgi:FkbM family methyltransferase